MKRDRLQLRQLHPLAAILAGLPATLFFAPSSAQVVIIGDNGTQVRNVPPSFGTVSTLILGNTATGNGTLNFSAGTIEVKDPTNVGESVTVGNSGVGAVNHSNLDDAVLHINVATPAPGVPVAPSDGNLFIGRNDGSSGSYTLHDVGSGKVLSLNVENTIQIGGSSMPTAPANVSCLASCALGSFNQSGGLVEANAVSIGLGRGEGTFNQTAGKLQVQTSLVLGQDGDAVGKSSGTYTLGGNGVISVSRTVVGSGGVGVFTQDGSSTHEVQKLFVGGHPTDLESAFTKGTYNLLNGTLTAASSTFVGQRKIGIFNQSGGTHTTASLVLGANFDSDGSYNLSAGVLNAGTAVVSQFDHGVFTQSGGIVNVDADLTVGAGQGTSEGLYKFSQGSITVGGNTIVGGGNSSFTGQPGGLGTFDQTGGNHAVAGDLIVGQSEIMGSGTGVYTLSGGVLTISGNTIVGAGNDNFNGAPGGSGKFVQSGGAHTSTDMIVGGFGAFAGGQGAYTINSDAAPSTLTVANLTLGQGGTCLGCTGATGSFTQSAGLVNVKDFLRVGEGVSTTGSYALSGGTLNVGNVTVVGIDGVGTFTQTNGTLNTGFLDVGFFGVAGNGTYTLSAGNVNITDNLVVGNGSATGTVNQNGGAIAVKSAGFGLFINNGTYNLNNGSLDVVNNSIVGDTFSGSLVQTGGAHHVGNALKIGSLPGVTGTYTMSGGTLTVAASSVVGANGNGVFNQSGGTHTTGLLIVGQAATGTGQYNLSGGTLNDVAVVGDSGVGVFNNSGGTHNVSGDLILGNQATGNGTYNLSATGSLSVSGSTIVGFLGVGKLNQTGGTATTQGLIVGLNSGAANVYDMSGGNMAVANNLVLGAQAGSSGTAVLSGAGTHLTVSGSTVVGDFGTGTFTQTGGAHTAAAVILGNGPSGLGTYNYNGGSLTLAGGTGTLQNNTGSTVNFGGSGTRVVDGNLTNAGVTNLATNAQVNVLSQNGGALNLNANNLSVVRDYTNSNFGVGNGFNAHADVTGTGQIIGIGTSQAIVGNVTNGASPSVTLNFGNVRGGTTQTLGYAVANTGASGASADLRGAVQTSFAGGGISDSRLGGSGVTAANFATLTGGANSGNLAVTFNAASGGSLTGQSVRIANNFDNVADQVINITAMASALAQGSATPNAPSPVNLGNFRVGLVSPGQGFTVSNTTAGAGAEQLGIGSATATGNFAATNNLGSALLAGGASQANAVTVAASGGTVGVNNGSLAIQFRSDGTNIDPTFVAQNANLQNIAVTATGYNVATGSAAPAGPISLGNFHVGQSGGAAPQNVNIDVRNVASGAFSEQLGVASASVNNTAFTLANHIGSGLVNGGATAANALNIARNGGAAGVNTGTISIQYLSDGTAPGSSGFGPTNTNTENITVNSGGYLMAAGNVSTPAVNFGTVQVGQIVANQNLTIRNTASGPSGFVEHLDASFGASTDTRIFGVNSVSLLAAGSNSNAMAVGLNTNIGPGVVNGTIAVNFASNGALTSGLGVTPLGSQNVPVTGDIQVVANFILQANPSAHTPEPVNLGAVRVGGSFGTRTLSLTNTLNPNGDPQAALNASIAPVSGPATASGAFNLLAPGATDSSSLTVGFAAGTSSTAGAKSGTASISLVSDAGNIGGCAPNCQVGLTPQTVNVTGNVYTAAVGQANTSSLDFGIVHVGDMVAGRNVSVTNAAAISALNDRLTGTLTAPGPFTANGSLGAGVAAGATDASSLSVGLNTGNAGIYSGQGLLTLSSHDSELADLALTPAQVDLRAQVNNYAEAAFVFGGGRGTLTRSGSIYTLDLGSVAQGSGIFSTTLYAANGAPGPANVTDLLDGTFISLDPADPADFGEAGFNDFRDFVAGQTSGPMTLSFNTASFGAFTDTIRLSGIGHNANFIGSPDIIELFVHGDVVRVSSVPEPGTFTLGLSGLTLLWMLRRRSGTRAKTRSFH